MRFFKETAFYREMLLLEFISENVDISQTDIAKHIDTGVGMVNNYINDLESKGYLLREYQSKKIVRYNITDEGIKRKKFLQISFMKELMDLYLRGQKTVSIFLDSVKEKNLHNILLYGAGDVANIILDMIVANKLDLEVVGIIDDDIEKIGKKLKNIDIISINDACGIEHDGIVITSYTFEEEIFEKLKTVNYPNEKIVKYFEL